MHYYKLLLAIGFKVKIKYKEFNIEFNIDLFYLILYLFFQRFLNILH